MDRRCALLFPLGKVEVPANWRLLLVVRWELHYKLPSSDLGYNVLPICSTDRMQTVLPNFTKALFQRSGDTNIYGKERFSFCFIQGFFIYFNCFIVIVALCPWAHVYGISIRNLRLTDGRLTVLLALFLTAFSPSLCLLSSHLPCFDFF